PPCTQSISHCSGFLTPDALRTAAGMPRRLRICRTAYTLLPVERATDESLRFPSIPRCFLVHFSDVVAIIFATRLGFRKHTVAKPALAFQRLQPSRRRRCRRFAQ